MNEQDTGMNRAQRREADKDIRHTAERKLKGLKQIRQLKQRFSTAEKVKHREAKAMKRAKARWDFRKRVGKEFRVNPSRVVLTCKLEDGEAPFMIRGDYDRSIIHEVKKFNPAVLEHIETSEIEVVKLSLFDKLKRFLRNLF